MQAFLGVGILFNLCHFVYEQGIVVQGGVEWFSILFFIIVNIQAFCVKLYDMYINLIYL